MVRRRTLRKRLQEVNLSPEEAEGLMELAQRGGGCVQSTRSSVDDCERFAQVMRPTIQVSAQRASLPEAPVPTPPSPERKAKRKHQAATAARRRNRREGGGGGMAKERW